MTAFEIDLSPRIVPFLDRHLVLILLEFLESRELYDKKDLLKSKHALLSETSMVDFSNEIYRELHAAKKSEPGFDKRRADVLARLGDLQDQVIPVLEIIQDPAVAQQLMQDKVANMTFLTESHNFEPKMLETLFNFSLLQYDVGNYLGASEMLYHFRILSTDSDLILQSIWGKLAADIMAKNWDGALEEIARLREAIEQTPAAYSPSQQSQETGSPSNAHSPAHIQLYQRSWLLHWSLFVFFNHDVRGRDALIDLFLHPIYLSAIQTACPWLIRYLAAGIITSKRRRPQLIKELVKIIRQESHAYSDPLTQLIEALYVSYDFDEAQQKLKACETVLDNDVFLHPIRDEILEAARALVFEMYCRIRQRIDLSALSTTLNMDQAQGEKWIVDLIRDVRMQAKIDSETNTVVMAAQYQSVYQNVMEKTKALAFRANILSANIEKREVELQNRHLGRSTGDDNASAAASGKKTQQKYGQKQQYKQAATTSSDE